MGSSLHDILTTLAFIQMLLSGWFAVNLCLDLAFEHQEGVEFELIDFEDLGIALYWLVLSYWLWRAQTSVG